MTSHTFFTSYIHFNSTQKKKDDDDDDNSQSENPKSKHPLRGAVQNRMNKMKKQSLPAFTFRKKKKGLLNDEVGDDGEGGDGDEEAGAGGFVEIGQVSRNGDEMSVKSGVSRANSRASKANGYNAPVISGFDNESDSDED